MLSAASSARRDSPSSLYVEYLRLSAARACTAPCGSSIVLTTLAGDRFAPQPPFCDALRSNISALHIVIQDTTGFQVLAYQLQVKGPKSVDDNDEANLATSRVLHEAIVGPSLAERTYVAIGLMDDTPHHSRYNVAPKWTCAWQR